jgi:hypothetical protein
VGSLRAELIKLESELSDITLRNQELETTTAQSQSSQSQSSQYHVAAATATSATTAGMQSLICVQYKLLEVCMNTHVLAIY